ncbi:bystin-like [Argonauta hians]
MGKVKGEKKPKNPNLADQILEDKTVRATGRTKSKQYRQDSDDEFVDEKLSRKILEQARAQQEELEEEHGIAKSHVKKKVSLNICPTQHSEDEESDKSDTESYVEQEITVSKDDEEALEMFMSKQPPKRLCLADIIMEKLSAKRTEINSVLSDTDGMEVKDMDPRVVEMYQNVRNILAVYRSGKLPKPFKIIPSLRNWEQVLHITRPEQWSAAAMYQGTRIFASNLNSKMAQRFFNLVLLPRIRDDIAQYKQLNYHLYMSLRKALFKPAAFFKGILIPLCEADCSLREATIVASILIKYSVPMLHAAAAMLKLCEMDYNGGTSIFLRALLDKKYALPYRVVDGIVYHFLGFSREQRRLPVLWHQSFLTFVQRYKETVSSEQKASLLEVLKVHNHPDIAPDIRWELLNSKCRDDTKEEPPAATGMEVQ